MSRERVGAWACGLVGAAVAANAVATTLEERWRKSEHRRHLGAGFQDDLSRMEARLAPLRPRLAERPWVLYASLTPHHELFEVQYVLVPTVLHWRPPRPGVSPPGGPGRQLVVANFPSADLLDRFLETQPHELRWRRDGAALLRPR